MTNIAILIKPQQHMKQNSTSIWMSKKSKSFMKKDLRMTKMTMILCVLNVKEIRNLNSMHKEFKRSENIDQ